MIRYETLSAAEQLLVDLVNGARQIRDPGDSRFGNVLQQCGFARMTHDVPGWPKKICIVPTQDGRNWVAACGLIKTPKAAATA